MSSSLFRDRAALGLGRSRRGRCGWRAMHWLRVLLPPQGAGSSLPSAGSRDTDVRGCHALSLRASALAEVSRAAPAHRALAWRISHGAWADFSRVPAVRVRQSRTPGIEPGPTAAAAGKRRRAANLTPRPVRRSFASKPPPARPRAHASWHAAPAARSECQALCVRVRRRRFSHVRVVCSHGHAEAFPLPLIRHPTPTRHPSESWDRSPHTPPWRPAIPAFAGMTANGTNLSRSASSPFLATPDGFACFRQARHERNVGRSRRAISSPSNGPWPARRSTCRGSGFRA